MDYQTWTETRDKEYVAIVKMLTDRGYTLDDVQPHIGGEKFLMHAVTTTSGQKLILLGTRLEDQKRVVIKGTSDPDGIAEIEHERTCRALINDMDFAYNLFSAPAEIDYWCIDGYTVAVQEYIDQTSTFLERPLETQFDFALQAFKDQEGVHATTYKHFQSIRKTFGVTTKDEYLEQFEKFQSNIKTRLPDNTPLHELLQETGEELTKNQHTIDQYTGFLTHTDFVPHNLRIRDTKIYLLDYSSLRFGNKYEGWARFANFMTLYNPPLATALEAYVEHNRAPEERESLHLMRLYRLGEIIWYYVDKLDKCDGDLHTLNNIRVDFWATVLSCVKAHTPVPESVLQIYKDTRDSLRSKEEKQRQIGLH